MPVFEIGLEDGRKLRIDAADQNAALAGVQHFLGNKEQPQQSGGVLDAARQGASGLVSGLGETGERYFGAGKALKDVGEKLAPQNPANTTLYDEQGFHAGNIPNAIAEGSPGMAAAIAAARLTPGPIWAKLAAGGLVGLGSMAGNFAKEATEKRTGDANAPSNPEDLTAGVVRAGPEAAIQALPLGRFVGAPVARLGAKGVVGSAGRTAVDAAAVGAGSAGAAGYDELYQNGEVDPTKVIDAAAKGAVTGGAFGAGRFARDAKAAHKYRGLSHEAPEHISEAANRVRDAGEKLGLNLKRTDDGFDAVKSAQTDVGTEFKAAIKDIKASTLSAESNAALARAQKGLPLGEADIAALNADTNNSPAVANLQRLGGVERSLQGFKNTGFADEARGTLTGGISGSLGHHVRGLSNPHGAIVGAGLMGLGGAHLGDAFAHSPAALAALGGGYTLARLADYATGNRSPAYAAVKRFATPQGVVPTAAPAQVNPPPPGGPGLQALAAQAVRLTNPTGPRVAPPFVSPWAPAPNQPLPQAPQPAPAPPAPFNAAPLKAAAQAAIKARMNALNMQTAAAPAPIAAPTPDLSGMRGAVQDAIKARMNVLKMQNASQPQAPVAPAQTAPVAAPVISPQPVSAPAEIRVQPEIAALVPVVTKLTKSNGKVKQKVEQKPAVNPGQASVERQAPGVSPAVDYNEIPDFLRRTEAPAAPQVQEAAKAFTKANGTVVTKRGLSRQIKLKEPEAPKAADVDYNEIPDFLRRDKVAPAAPEVQTATKAMVKLNAGPTYTPVRAGDMKPLDVLSMSHEKYADYKLAQKDAQGKAPHDPAAYRKAVIAGRAWKEGVATKLADLFPQFGKKLKGNAVFVGNSPSHGKAKSWFFGELESHNTRAPIEQLREHLKSLDPSKADAVDELLSDTQLRRIWAVRGKR